jgi:hypothetical protein
MISAIFIDTSSYSARLANPVFFAMAAACALHLGIRRVGIPTVVELRDVLEGGHEALNTFVAELDLLYLLCDGGGGVKQSESQKRGE